MKEANWEVIEFQILLQQSQELHHKFEDALASIADANRAEYVLPEIHDLASQSFMYLRNLFKKKRIAATHVLVLMLSDEKRSRKPYALPVRFVPCGTLKDQFIRDLTKYLKEEMTKRNLCVTGEPLVIFLPSVLKTCCTKIWMYTMLGLELKSIQQHKNIHAAPGCP